VDTLEDAFIGYLQDAEEKGKAHENKPAPSAPVKAPESKPGVHKVRRLFKRFSFEVRG
jgi:hypothetical protein